MKHSRHKGRRGSVGREKAKEILRHGEVRGHKLTARQRRFFGARAGGAPVKRRRRRGSMGRTI